MTDYNKNSKTFKRLVKAAHARVARSESRNLSVQEKARRQAWRDAYDQRPTVARPHHGTYLDHHPAKGDTMTMDTGRPLSVPTLALMASAVLLGGK